ncbi:MAG: hypothetical protein J5964_07880 [Eubacterium sp.]|nr:hypothetical protein [Eubacterium sp.]
MKKIRYEEPEFSVIKTNSQDIMTVSGGDDFNTLGDLMDTVFYKNSNWTIEI